MYRCGDAECQVLTGMISFETTKHDSVWAELECFFHGMTRLVRLVWLKICVSHPSTGSSYTSTFARK